MPEIRKAVAVVVMTLAGLAQDYLLGNPLDTDPLVVAITGIVTAGLVYLIPNQQMAVEMERHPSSPDDDGRTTLGEELEL